MPPTTRQAPADADLDEIISIKHDKVEAQGVCTRRQLRDVWADKGWSEADTAPEEVAAAAVASLASVTSTAPVGTPAATATTTGS